MQFRGCIGAVFFSLSRLSSYEGDKDLEDLKSPMEKKDLTLELTKTY